jgi:hypothetical protein
MEPGRRVPSASGKARKWKSNDRLSYITTMTCLISVMPSVLYTSGPQAFLIRSVYFPWEYQLFTWM